MTRYLFIQRTCWVLQVDFNCFNLSNMYNDMKYKLLFLGLYNKSANNICNIFQCLNVSLQRTEGIDFFLVSHGCYDISGIFIIIWNS